MYCVLIFYDGETKGQVLASVPLNDFSLLQRSEVIGIHLLNKNECSYINAAHFTQGVLSTNILPALICERL